MSGQDKRIVWQVAEALERLLQQEHVSSLQVGSPDGLAEERISAE